MIYSDIDIDRAIRDDVLGVRPYDPTRLQPSSLDLTLGTGFIAFRSSLTEQVVDPFVQQQDYEVPFESTEPTVIQPGDLLLACTHEWVFIGAKIAGRVEGKSSLARLGLIVHTTAGFIDPGFSGQITLELVNVSPRPILLTPGMPIAQLAVLECKTPARQDYDRVGKYGHQRGPTASRYYLNPRPDVG